MEIRHRKSCLYSANPAWNVSTTVMKTCPKFLISGTKHAKTNGFFTLLMENSLTHQYPSSAELSGLMKFVFTVLEDHGNISCQGQKELSSCKQEAEKVVQVPGQTHPNLPQPLLWFWARWFLSSHGQGDRDWGGQGSVSRGWRFLAVPEPAQDRAPQAEGGLAAGRAKSRNLAMKDLWERLKSCWEEHGVNIPWGQPPVGKRGSSELAITPKKHGWVELRTGRKDLHRKRLNGQGQRALKYLRKFFTALNPN